jgi:NAD(P)-dependent dehydrogenase (short-subunit alcohol dehydrogenase family)
VCPVKPDSQRKLPLKTAIVTGCLGAIGRATCVELRTAGFDLVGIDKPANADFAGSYHACDLADASAVSRVYAINVRAVFQLSQEVARWMVAQELAGSIVNIASIAGKLGSPIIPYGTSKAAIIGLTRSMAKVLGPHGIRVNAIAPGVIATPMSAAVDEAQMRKQLANVSMERMGDPQEIAKVVAFLATADAGYMSGSIVDVNGGWMA